MNKKIFYISGSINFGSPGRICEQTALLAEAKGYECYIAHSTRNANPSKINNSPVTTKNEEILHALGAMLFDLHGLMSTKQTQRLVKKIKKFNPDIIHLHNIHGYYLNFKVLFEYLDTLDTPIVWTMHDCWSFTGRCSHFVGINCEKWKTGCHHCKAESGYTVSKFVDRSKQLYKLKKELFSSVKNLTMVPVSDWVASFLPDSFLKNCKVKVIHNGVDIQLFKPVYGNRLREKYNLNEKFVILGVASPWCANKGLDDFIKLRAMLADNFSIILVGLKTEQIKRLPKGIIGITKTESQQELAEYYSMSDVFCNLTYLDTFPTVNLEALACGTPVLTYRTGGSSEAIESFTGKVVAQGNLVGIFDELCAMLKKPFDRTKCREHVEKNFDKDKCFYEYIQLYNDLLRDNEIH